MHHCMSLAVGSLPAGGTKSAVMHLACFKDFYHRVLPLPQRQEDALCRAVRPLNVQSPCPPPASHSEGDYLVVGREEGGATDYSFDLSAHCAFPKSALHVGQLHFGPKAISV